MFINQTCYACWLGKYYYCFFLKSNLWFKRFTKYIKNMLDMINYQYKIYFYFKKIKPSAAISRAHHMVGWRNFYFPSNSGGIACSVAEINAALVTTTQERGNENINLNKYFISSIEDRVHHQSRLQSYLVLLRYNWPQIILF